MIPESFHFLRPAWLLALAALLPLGWTLLRRAHRAGAWERVCDAHLLRHLVADDGGRAARWPAALLALGWIAACLALAGPTVERLPQTAYRDPGRTVFVLGLADSMNQTDVKPSRLARARHKLLDALDVVAKSGGSIGLVAYKEEGFAVTPLTDDAAVLREAIPLLETRLMPGRRVLPARGLEEAKRLLEPQGFRGARIVLVTDGSDADPSATQSAAAALAEAGVRLSVLSVLPHAPGLESLARGGGAYATLTVDDADITRVLVSSDDAHPAGNGALTTSEATTDEWNDLGAWLVWVPLALAPLAFRRGWAAAAATLLYLQLAPASARAGALDAFERPDQRAADLFDAGRYAASAQEFEDPAWQAAARYRAGDYAGAAQLLAGADDPAASYNLGNALAKSGKLEEAVAAYDRALATRPEDEDARFNRDLVKTLLEQQKQQTPRPQPPHGGERGKDDPPQAAPEARGGPGENGDAGGSASPDGNEAAQQAGPTSPGAQDAASGAQGRARPGDEPPHASATADATPDDGTAEPGGNTPATSGRPPGTLGPDEQQRAQWMARLPDDPGGLLREKIRRDYLRKQAERHGEDRS